MAKSELLLAQAQACRKGKLSPKVCVCVCVCVRERERERERVYGQLKSPLLFIWKFAVVYVRYPSNFRQRLRIHDSQWPLVSVQDWLQLGQSLVRIAANLICSIYLLSHLSFMPKTLCPIIELYIYKLVKNLSKLDSFRLCKLSTHWPQVIRTSETWGKPQTLKKS